jgi:serine protease inhibitor
MIKTFVVKRKKKLMLLSTLALLIIIPLNITACSAVAPKVKAKDLMEEVKPNAVNGQMVDERFINNAADFTVGLFKQSIDQQDNCLVSPISVMLALAMTANGADGETLSQMEKVLGNDIALEELNKYLRYYSNHLPNHEKSKLKIANSIWFRDDENRLMIEKDFLQKNADYYNAEIYKSPFSDQTLLDINNWVKRNTDGLIERILEEIEDDTIMYLINAIVFDAEWKVVYNKENIYQKEFTAIDGTAQMSDFMRSEESLYLDDGSATGFIKPYYDDKYSFAALLPNEGITIEDYIANLSGERLLNTINRAELAVVNASMPKFSYEYEIILNDVLKIMGMPDGFQPAKADFTKMGKSSRGNIYIGEVLHKTFISLDELGTKAGAVTKVEMKDEGAPMDLKIVTLDRPFIYAIIDNSTNLPIFIGTVVSLK